MTTQMIICLGLFLFMILGYVFADKLHTTTGVVALATIVLVAYSGLVNPGEVIANFGNANAILIVSMFIISTGFSRTQAINKLTAMVYKVSGGKFTIMLTGYAILTFALAQCIPSPLAVFAVVCPLAASMAQECGVSPTKVMFPLCLVDVGTTAAMPVGQGAVTFATFNGYLESYGYTTYQMHILDFAVGRLPMVILVILYAIFIAPRVAPDKPSVPITMNDSSNSGRGGSTQPPLDPLREFLGYFIFAMTTVALVFQGTLGLASWQIALTGAALVVVTGVLKPQEAAKAIPIRIVFLLVAALSVGGAMVACGLGDLIGNTIAAAMGGTRNGYIIGAVFFIIPFALTQVMQNQTVSNIFIPILILACKALGCSPVGPLVLLNAACLTAFLTPMATPVVPVVMDAGGYSMKDLFKQGWLPSIIICIVSIFWVMTVFPAFP